MSSATTSAAPDATRGGKYLTFYLGGEEYGVAIMKVQEIIGLQPITRVPRTPSFMRGVINLRGKVIPIVDLRDRFGMPASETTMTDERGAATAAALRCIIVVEVAMHTGDESVRAHRVSMGIVVDRVSEVAPIAESDIEDAPSFGPGVRTDYLLGIAKSRTADAQRGAGASGDDTARVRLLLDLDRVLAADEVAQLPAATDAAS